MQSSKVLMFSLATYGYDIIWDQCIQSHKQYAHRHSYDYFCINHVPRGYTNDQVVWAKLPLIVEWCKYYDRVVFVDADCMIQKGCPAIQTLEQENKYLYMAPGFSGRINSWVIIGKNSNELIKKFNQITANKETELPQEDSVWWVFGWGENGHMIHYCKDWPHLQLLDKKRNNNHQPDLDDYIRHFSWWGPMRWHYKLSFAGKIQATKLFIQTLYKKIRRKLWLSKWHQSERIHTLWDLTKYCIENYFPTEDKN